MTVIKVNLLDYRKLKRIMQLQKELLLYLLGISFALVAIGIVWQNQNNRIKEVNSEITHWNVELKKIDKTVKKVDEAKAKKKRITHILKSIKILKKKQTDPAQLLDEINKNLPSEVWLTRFDETAAKVRLEGYSFSDPAIAIFMKNLEKLSAYFRSIELIETRRAKVSGEIVRRFSIQCTR
ncbi:MAG TPA: PilN domain-containing protein [Nitrospinota bacterium]|nr:PilN domain-containing protein [Nitrospinota bacterium]